MDILEVVRRTALVVFLAGGAILVVLALALISRTAGPHPLTTLFCVQNKTLIRATVITGAIMCVSLATFGLSTAS